MFNILVQFEFKNMAKVHYVFLQLYVVANHVCHFLFARTTNVDVYKVIMVMDLFYVNVSFLFYFNELCVMLDANIIFFLNYDQKKNFASVIIYMNAEK